MARSILPLGPVSDGVGRNPAVRVGVQMPLRRALRTQAAGTGSPQKRTGSQFARLRRLLDSAMVVYSTYLCSIIALKQIALLFANTFSVA